MWVTETNVLSRRPTSFKKLLTRLSDTLPAMTRGSVQTALKRRSLTVKAGSSPSIGYKRRTDGELFGNHIEDGNGAEDA